MKENIFYVVLNIRTAEGFENFGKFNLGNDREAAVNVFRQFKGSAIMDDNSMLTIDFMETINELPVNVQIMACTLDELADNCKIIAKETFKIFNLK
ncbi:MAG: hypothetical protein E6H07_08505 [Bacteroidetes bacterium]|nr:MAG: hypothetical protein E6H07_08505 [Bacteroidota bacterium]